MSQHRLLSPSERMKMIEERLPIWQLTLKLTRLAHAEHYPDGRLGEDIQLLYVGMAVGIGDLEDRPMSTNKIAGYLGLTRRTAQRRLDRLVELGAIWRDDTGYRLSRGKALAHTRHIPPAWHAVAAAAQRLPKLRTIMIGQIADKKP
ncbi:MAG: hypothetical protein ACXVDA_14550 [Ktedonobacterales bacterium]